VTPGTLLADSQFRFHDGETGNKILVVLGALKGIAILVKTTSRGERYALSFGCQAKNRFPCFHLPKNSCCLSRPTWVCLDEFYEINHHRLLQKHFSGEVRQIGKLPDDIVEQLLECALDCDDLAMAQADIVRAARNAL
jgi:hypothetical protein